MKVAFAGTPEFAATVLRGLDGSTHEIGLVVSQPDPRRGRGRSGRGKAGRAAVEVTGSSAGQTDL